MYRLQCWKDQRDKDAAAEGESAEERDLLLVLILVQTLMMLMLCRFPYACFHVLKNNLNLYTYSDRREIRLMRILTPEHKLLAVVRTSAAFDILQPTPTQDKIELGTYQEWSAVSSGRLTLSVLACP